jgi:hypothetical protein
MTTTPDMPALTGSEKQIAWAEGLRAARLPLYRAAVATIAADPDVTEDELALASECLAVIEACTSAADWIDTREHGRGLYSTANLMTGGRMKARDEARLGKIRVKRISAWFATLSV